MVSDTSQICSWWDKVVFSIKCYVNVLQEIYLGDMEWFGSCASKVLRYFNKLKQ